MAVPLMLKQGVNIMNVVNFMGRAALTSVLLIGRICRAHDLFATLLEAHNTHKHKTHI
jgi:hypothetical protein